MPFGKLVAERPAAEGAARVWISAPPCLTRALLRVLPALGVPLEIGDAEASAAQTAGPAVGILSFELPDELKRRFLCLDALGCWPILALGEPGVFAAVTAGLRPELRREAERFVNLPLLLGDVLTNIGQVGAAADPRQLRETAATRFFRAEQLFSLLSDFAHNGRWDITNLVFGPIRLMLTVASAGERRMPPLKRRQKEALRLFQERVVAPLVATPSLYGELGSTLAAAFRDVHGGITNRELQDPEPLLESLDIILGSLTKARELAGQTTSLNAWASDQDTRMRPLKPGAGRRGVARFRILVIDDFAPTWRPVIEQVSAALAARQLITEFEFSLDGKTVDRAGAGLIAVDQALPSYDLVLLDIFLGSESGLEILERIRSRFLWLPLILWTTSVASEVPAQAQLANGFLFKKRTTVSQIVQLLERWLPEGRARRDAGLSSRLFDTTLRSPRYRECAIAFERACLKIMDGFHALDDSYFRFYTDHGGRHIQSLLHIVEMLVSPFLGTSVAAANRVFSDDMAERERELLQLCLAVHCHELGMFPLRGEQGPPKDRGCLEAIRVTHAVRGMLALVDDRHLPKDLDEAVRVLRQTGADAQKIMMAVAVLTGYHSRLLDISRASFLDRAGNGECEARLAKARLNCKEATELPDARQVAQLLEAAGALFSAEAERERLRRQCALLRFADALDVDHTRTPVEFLLLDPRRNHLAIREHVKREVLDHVEFAASGIRLHFNAPRPSSELLRKLLDDAPAALELDVALAGSWPPKSRDWLISIQKRLDAWLAYYWMEVTSAHRPGELTPQQERQRGELAEAFPALDRSALVSSAGRAAAASMTTLSVAGEIFDEFSAVEKCDLQGGPIQLGSMVWTAQRNFRFKDLPLLSYDYIAKKR